MAPTLNNEINGENQGSETRNGLKYKLAFQPLVDKLMMGLVGLTCIKKPSKLWQDLTIKILK